jgi:hypothetical protein
MKETILPMRDEILRRQPTAGIPPSGVALFLGNSELPVSTTTALAGG